MSGELQTGPPACIVPAPAGITLRGIESRSGASGAGATAMFGLHTPELIVIFVILVLLFGASRLPGLGSALGGALRGFKRAVDGRLAEQGVSLGSAEASVGWGPASYHLGSAEERGRPLAGVIGFIGPMTESFCATCNRVRVGPDGALRPCLARREEVPLRDLLRPGAPRGALEVRVRAALLAKAPRHDFCAMTGPRASMSTIGG